LRKVKKEEVTADTVANFIEAGQANVARSGHGMITNLGEDNDPNLDINPVAVERLHQAKLREAARRNEEKAAAAAAKKAQAMERAKAAQASHAKNATTRRAVSGLSWRLSGARGRPALTVLGVNIESGRLPARTAMDVVPERTVVGLKDIDAQLAVDLESAGGSHAPTSMNASL